MVGVGKLHQLHQHGSRVHLLQITLPTCIQDVSLQMTQDTGVTMAVMP